MYLLDKDTLALNARVWPVLYDVDQPPQVALSIFSGLPGFSLAMILAPIIGALRIFKKPSGVLFTTAQLALPLLPGTMQRSD